MKLSACSLRLAALLPLLAIALLSSATAHADTYTVYNLGNDNGRSLYGISTTGAVVIDEQYNCANTATNCYDTWVNGEVVSVTTAPPSLDYDDGSPCDSLPPGDYAAPTDTIVCNNGYIGFGLTGTQGTEMIRAVTGPISDPQIVWGGTVNQSALNSIGDFAWADAQDEYFYEAVDTTNTPVPEPSGLILIGTGILSLPAALRRSRSR
jgi:hypothetical protein